MLKQQQQQQKATAPGETSPHSTDRLSQDNDTLSPARHPTSTSDQNEAHDESDQDRVHEFTPPFLVRTRSKIEKDELHQKLQQQKKTKSPYSGLFRFYERYSASILLENKAAVARDHLANERTFLAWLRTSLSLITVGVAITQLYHLTPATGDGRSRAAGRALGATFVVFSMLFLYFANVRYFHSQVALTKGMFPASRGAVLFGSTCVLAVLIAMFVVILTEIN
ncbi:hypothetical protein DFQ29_003732 [Apophysomyces sp. BC1021]|nr:hypothetical protein DFQ29_003732 [Apophysomyces sp. BC1021]